ncbi:unnamed protein product [Diabrotica balteata]|uniref:Insulin-like domain-containing protein n=1 Tax=Diabrotica balteata TaxID=107213 RepID=A0A9N9T279_DIABA|nr:unnamed protein product [Diabrotica balteata]
MFGIIKSRPRNWTTSNTIKLENARETMLRKQVQKTFLRLLIIQDSYLIVCITEASVITVDSDFDSFKSHIEFEVAKFSHTIFRRKRQIVNECCRNKCSLDYLLDNYCQTVNSAALEEFKKTKDDSSERYTLPKSPTENILSRRFRQKHGLDNAPSEPATHDSHQHHRKKRNCKCKKLLKNEEKHQKERRLLIFLKQRQYPVPASEVEEAEFQKPFIVNFP